MDATVENYTQDFGHWMPFARDGRGAYGIKQVEGRLAKRKLARLLRDAKEHFDGFDIVWSRYGMPTVTFMDMLTASIEWPHLTSGRKLCLTGVWWDDKTGSILQAGTNYGDLTL